MKNYLSIILLFLFISCNNANEKANDIADKSKTANAYSWEEYENIKSKNPNQNINVIDTICPFETKKAKADIANGNLVYYCGNYPEVVVKELEILMLPYHIKAQYTSYSCIPPPKGFTENCYGQLMYDEIEKRYGEKWIDSLERLAVKNYVIKHPNQPYDENGIDLRTKFIKK